MFIKAKQRNRAFNLLEVVIASFLFSVIAVAFLGVWGIQVRAVEKSRHNLVATLLAEQIIEEVMGDGYELTGVTSEDEPRVETIPMEIESRGADGQWSTINVVYDTQVEVVELGSGDTDKLKQVMVSVTWKDSTKTGKVVLETYLAGAF